MSFCGICGYDVVMCNCLDDDDDEEDREWCPRCQGEGRVPSPDFLAIKGISYVACMHCEGGLQWPEYM